MSGKIGNYVGGPIFIPLGTDGTDVYGITVDSSGHLQVDVLSLEGLDDLATQTTLAGMQSQIGAIGGGDAGTLLAYLLEIQARLGDESSPLSGSVNYQLDEIDDRLDAIKATRGDVDYAPREGVLASSLNWTSVLSVGAKGILVGLDLSSDYGATEWRVVADGDDLGLPTRTGSNIYYSSFDRLNDLGGKSTFFEEGVYDDVNDYYSVFLKREIHYTTGLVVYCRQVSGSNKNVAVAIYYQGVS